MKRFMLYVLCMLAALAPASAGAAELTEGKDYARLKNPQPVETGKKIEVIEFFLLWMSALQRSRAYPARLGRETSV